MNASKTHTIIHTNQSSRDNYYTSDHINDKYDT